MTRKSGYIFLAFCVILFGCERRDRQDVELLGQDSVTNTSQDVGKQVTHTTDGNEKQVIRTPVRNVEFYQGTTHKQEERQASLYQKTRETASRTKRMQAILDSLTEADWEGIKGTHPKVAAILVEGMDTLSAAKYLVEFGHDTAAQVYIERAVAEKPGDFDALLFKTQQTVDAKVREAGYRLLFEMCPDSVDVLVGLGSVLSYHQPEEAIVYLQKAVAHSPEHPDALLYLSESYRLEGQLTKALVAAEKAYDIAPYSLASAHLSSIKQEIENARNEKKDVQALDIQTSLEP